MKCHKTFIANEKMANKLFAFYSKSHKRTAHLKVKTNFKYWYPQSQMNSYFLLKPLCFHLKEFLETINSPLFRLSRIIDVRWVIKYKWEIHAKGATAGGSQGAEAKPERNIRA